MCQENVRRQCDEHEMKREGEMERIGTELLLKVFATAAQAGRLVKTGGVILFDIRDIVEMESPLSAGSRCSHPPL